MARKRRHFGPLTYVTAGVAVLLLGSQPLWEPTTQGLRAWRLSRRLRDPSAPVRRQAEAELVKIGPAATWWMARASRDPDPQVRGIACSVLCRRASEGDAAAAEALLAAVGDADDGVRSQAVGSMARIVSGAGLATDSPPAIRAIRAMGTALRDPSPKIRRSAAWGLAPLGPRAGLVLADLDRALNGPDKSLRPLVASILLGVEPEAARPRVIAAMSAILGDTSIRFERQRIFWVLNEIQGQDATAAMLTPLLRHPDRLIRLQAIHDLIGHCLEARSLRSTLLAVLDGDDDTLRYVAAIELMRQNPGLAEKAVEALAEQMVRPIDGSLVNKILVKRVWNESPGTLGPLARSLSLRLFRSDKPSVRLNAIMALREIGSPARCAIPALQGASRSADPMIAMRAVAALARIDPTSAAVRIPSLLDWTTPAHKPDVRLAAIAALGDLGPTTDGAVPSLLELADEDDLAVATTAIAALGKIDPAQAADLKRDIERGASRSPQDD